MPETQAWQRLVSVVLKLSIAHDLPTIMRIVRSAARDLTGADGATFILRDGNQCFYADEDAIAPLWKGQRFPMSACVSGWVMLNRKPAMIEDIYADPRVPADAYRPTFVKSLAMVPIRSDNPLGAIGNYWASRHAPTESEITLLQALADSTSLALANLELLRDLDHRVQEETRLLAEANKELEAFSYSVSHDLRSPLTAIKGYAELIAEDYGHALGSDGTGILSGIGRSVEKMSELIDALLSLGRLSRAELKPRPLDLRPAVMEIIERLRAAAPGRAVDFHVADDLTAEGDPSLLRIVLDNLLSNAWKYSAKRPSALIEVGKVPGSPILLFVRDNGAGFDAARADRLFMPFQRLHAERDFPGVGIGLATVRRIVARHGGNIWADSAPGQGATFCFTLPVSGAIRNCESPHDDDDELMPSARSTVVLFLSLLCGCAAAPPPIGHWFGPDAPAKVLVQPAPGTNGAARMVTTDHYKIFTTIKDSAFVDRIAQLMEGSLTAYRTLAPGAEQNNAPMECYIFQDRSQWSEFTREHGGEMTPLLLKINRGGYTMPFDGWFVSYNVGETTTLSIAAHEGWHQFLVYHSRASLPRFLEEGLATMFEDVQFKDGLPLYNLSINQNRAIALRSALENNTTWPLSDLLAMNAGDIVDSRGDKIEAWYAQAWALGRFLWDGDGGAHRAALQQIIADTANGTVYDPSGPHRNRLRGWSRDGVKAMLEHYLQMDFAEIDEKYRAFCKQVAYDELPAMSETP